MTNPRRDAAGRIQVLFGHRVTKLTNKDAIGPGPANTVEPAELRQFLSSRRGWISLESATLAEELSNPLPQAAPRFLMTFDDGYHDNLTELVPILEEHAVSAIIFVTTGFVGQRVLPPEQLLAHIVRTCTEVRTFARRRHLCADVAEKWDVYNSLKRRVKMMTPRERCAYLRDLASINGVAPYQPGKLFLNWDEVRELDRHPLITIGAHSRHHGFLPGMTRPDAFEEIKACKIELEEQLGHEIDCFAYPYGGQNLMIRRLVAQAGFRFAFTTRPRHLRRIAERQRFRIPRIDLKSTIEAMQA